MDAPGLRQEAEGGGWLRETGPADALHPPRRGISIVKKWADAALGGTRLGDTETRTGPVVQRTFPRILKRKTYDLQTAAVLLAIADGCITSRQPAATG